MNEIRSFLFWNLLSCSMPASVRFRPQHLVDQQARGFSDACFQNAACMFWDLAFETGQNIQKFITFNYLKYLATQFTLQTAQTCTRAAMAAFF